MARNHIDIAGRRECPPRLLERLRLIDPNVDLHYIGEGKWCLGSVRWTRPRYQEAGQLLRECVLGSHAARRLAELGLYGFAKIEVYEIKGEPDARIVKDFRERQHRYQSGRNRMFAQKLREADGEARREQSIKDDIEEIEARVADSYGNFFRGRKSFVM